MDAPELGPVQLDALREAANIGAGHAATALSQIAGRRIMVTVPEVSVLPLEQAGTMLGAADEVVGAVIVRVLGDVTARTLQLFPGTTAARLASLARATAEPAFPAGFGEAERSALEEIGYILVGAYLGALGQLLGLELTMSAPAVAIDMAAAVLTTSYLNFGSDDEQVICIDSDLLLEGGEDLNARFLLQPDGPSLETILRALRVA
ncbi:MAG: chemotaxis protein CheC [Longimicrobiales bacterium]